MYIFTPLNVKAVWWYIKAYTERMLHIKKDMSTLYNEALSELVKFFSDHPFSTPEFERIVKHYLDQFRNEPKAFEYLEAATKDFIKFMINQPLSLELTWTDEDGVTYLVTPDNLPEYFERLFEYPKE